MKPERAPRDDPLFRSAPFSDGEERSLPEQGKTTTRKESEHMKGMVADWKLPGPLPPLATRDTSEDSTPYSLSSGCGVDWSILDQKLYGRERERKELVDAFNRCTSGDGEDDFELVLVTAPSGSGKTALTQAVLPVEVRKRGGFFISGKFDQLERSEQYYPIVQAFTDFVKQVLERNESTLLAVQDAVRPIVETESALVDMIPALKQLVFSDDVSSEVVKGPNAESLLRQTFCRFVRALSCPSRPLILFLDDLQWADSASLNLIHALVSGSEIRSFMILGACRGNEVSLEHDLSVHLRAMEAEFVKITTICLSDLNAEAICEMLSNVLEQPESRCADLASLIFARTAGNALHVRQLFITLSEERLFVQDDETGNFPWEAEATALDDVFGESAVLLISKRIQRTLGPRAQLMLTIASCLGAEFEESILSVLACNAKLKYDLARAERAGLVFFLGGQRWRFVHDQIQMACYGFTPDAERDMFHLKIGLTLLRELMPDVLDMQLFLVLDQLRHGIEMIESEHDREKIALLCLKAGEKATRASSFKTAAHHLHRGISLLSSRNWRDQYHLSLELYNATAEVEYCNGNFDRMDELLHEILENARVFSDRVRAYTTRVFSLGTRSNLQEAVALGIEVLRGLGENFPARPRTYHVVLELMKTNRILSKFSDRDILNLDKMTDPTKFAVMRLASIIITYSYAESSLYAPLLAMRLVQITLLNGISVMSSTAISCWAVLLCNIVGRVEDGVRYARLSLKLLEMLEAREYRARTTIFANGFCLIWTDLLCDQLVPLRQAHLDGLGSGDIETAFLCACVYGRIAIHVSVKLPQLADEMQSFVDAAKTYNQDIHLQFLRPLLQMTRNLCGQADNLTVMTGDAMDEDASYKYAIETNHLAILASVSVFKLMLCYHFGDVNEACRISTMIDKKCKTETFSSLALGDAFLFQGLAALSRPTRRTRWFARRKLKKLQWIADLNPTTFLCKVLILEGEMAASKGQIHQAVDCFDRAAESACKDKVWGEKGLAYERAAVVLLQSGRKDLAVEYFDHAIEAYNEWGAWGKVDYILKTLQEQGLTMNSRSIVNIRS